MAHNYVGRLIESERVKRRWSFGDLARGCGAVTARQVSKVSRQLVVFEREAVTDPILLSKVVRALDLDAALVSELLLREHEERFAEWKAWADEPVRPELAIKAGPIWISRSLPVRAETEHEAIEFTERFAREHPMFRIVILIYDRRVRHFFRHGIYMGRREASVEDSVTPYMSIGGQTFTFTKR